MSEITVENLTRSFEKKQRTRGGTPPRKAVDNVSFTVQEGELLVLLGPSGCGKTTTLRSIAGLETPDNGSVKIDSKTVFDSGAGVMVPAHRRDIGMVFQSYALWPHLTAFGNIEFPLVARRESAKRRREAVRRAAAAVDLSSDLLQGHPGQLSGGQQQRVALARALVARPRVMLFDEPLSNLDALLREQLRQELRRLHQSVGFTGVYVTHDLPEALDLATRVAVMREGRIAQIDSPQTVFERPADAATARLVGYRELGVINSNGSADGSDKLILPRGIEVPPASRVSVFARIESVTVTKETAELTGQSPIASGVVTAVAMTGNRGHVTVDYGSQTIRVATSSDNELRTGDQVHICVRPDDIRLFPAESNTR